MNKYLASLLLVLSICLTGCQADVTTTVLFNGDGSGNITVKTELDEELSRRVAGLEVNPVTQFQERVASTGSGWTVEAPSASAENPRSLAVSKGFKNIDELQNDLTSLRESIHPLGVHVVPEISVTQQDDTFDVNATLPLQISDEFSVANHYANAADLVKQVGTEVSSSLHIGSKTGFISGSANDVAIPKPSDEAATQDAQHPQTFGVTSHLGQTSTMNLKYEVAKGSSWLIIVIGIVVFLVLARWIYGVFKRAKLLREYRQLHAKPRH